VAMSNQSTMVFFRDDDQGFGCLEYSWVPSGQRRVIQLNPNQSGETRVDSYYGASHVQIYSVASGGLGLDKGHWQFPAGPSHGSPVLAAVVQVFTGRKELIGTVIYADGTTASSSFPLIMPGSPCPQLPG
jgi:hypothetical protein